MVTSCSASRLICRSSSARLSEAALIRFCVINIKVERKIASTDATIAKITKDGSNLGTPGHETEIGEDPEAIYNDVHVDKPYGPAETGDRSGDAFFQCRRRLLALSPLLEHPDVARKNDASPGGFGEGGGRPLFRSCGLLGQRCFPFVFPFSGEHDGDGREFQQLGCRPEKGVARFHTGRSP